MALMQWEPSESLATLQREVNRLLESFFDGSPLRFGESITAPAVEVSDMKDTVVIKAQVPGVSKEQIQVTVSEGMITIKGERKKKKRRGEELSAPGVPLWRVHAYGALPAGVQAEKATAQLKDGMLEVTIPKSAEARVKEIPISV